jgi:hypothetical protein
MYSNLLIKTLGACGLVFSVYIGMPLAMANTFDLPTETPQKAASPARWQDINFKADTKRWSWSPSLYLSQARSDFNWSIASNGRGDATPNILSELTYRDLQSTHWHLDNTFNYNVNGQWSWTNQVKLATGVIDSGQVQDSDYDSDHRQNEYSRSYSYPKGSVLRDVILASGLQRQLSPHWQGSGLIGVSQHRQAFSKTNGEQVLATQNRTPSVGKFGGLSSSYAADWQSIWLGIGASWQSQGHQLTWQVEQHLSNFYAEANWNLRSDFAHPKSFDQLATGQAQVLSMRYQKVMNPRLNLLINWQTEHWHTDAGIDTVYFANGGKATTRLNEAKWQTQRLSIGLNLTTW